MTGRDVLWQPGTDHAGIATQMVVERLLAAEGKTRQEMGRDAFLERVWQWKAESGGTITRQLRRLGASLDWPRERFTMDEGLSRAVRRIFVMLHEKGLIYRARRLVNWDPKFQSAISDLEVESREMDGSLWHITYPIEGMEGRFITVATTRPETLPGDTAVAVNPADERYQDLIGRFAILPLVGRRIPIVADEHSDPTKGTGAVKITPAHDFNDFAVGKRHDLPMPSVLDRQAAFTLDEIADELRAVPGVADPGFLQGLAGADRFKLRAAIVAELKRLELLAKVEKHRNQVPHGDRSGVPIEPLLTVQWFCDAATLAKPAVEAVEQGRTVFVPKQWENTFFAWLRDIEPWCISRQLWWGHRIPAWYGPDGTCFVAEDEAGAQAQARAAYGAEQPLVQDEDVLDTWFSSGLWPFSTLGWPDQTPELPRYYPTDVLVTGFDIIFFWVARMMMMGIEFMGEVPFKRVIMNGLVRDERGQKMSKSKGNVIDPLEVIDDLGCDALRFTLTILSGARDIKLSKARIEGYRNFGTKLWNAARFCQMNECVAWAGFDPNAARETLNRWIRGETVKTAAAVTAALEAGAFDQAAGALYRFVWNVFCDWYLELAKPILNGDDEVAKAETRAMAAWTLDQTLKLLHPVSPFITEALWAETAEFGPKRQALLIETAWPVLPGAWVDAAASAEIDWLIDLVSAVRSIRAEMNVPPSARPALSLVGAGSATQDRLARNRDRICALARLDAVRLADAAPAGTAPFVIDEATGALAIAEFIDLAAEKARLAKEIAALDQDIARISKKLDNADFIARAPEAVVEENRTKQAEAQVAKAKLEGALARLKGLA
jgi:valyl-tRNA synthetase